MLQIEFIPLKTPDGITCGHARVRDGAVDVHLRTAVRGQAMVLTDAGLVGGDARAHIRAGGHVRAVALQEQGALRCCGFARNETMTADDLRRRLVALSASAPGVARMPADQPPALADDGGPYDESLAAMQALRRLNSSAARADTPPRTRSAESFPRRAADAPYVPVSPRAEAARSEPVSAPAQPAAAQAAPVQAAPPQAASVQAAPAQAAAAQAAPVQAEPERIVPAGDPASFGVLCERYDAVAADIRRVSPSYVRPAEPAAEPEHAAPAAEPAASKQPRVIRTPTQNPFPHIFPNARFYREEGAPAETLVGIWQRGTERMRITAVLGDYSPQPPSHLEGFTRYIRSRSGGYWVRVD